ncbi:MAG: DUF928 domain-containing protein, partial [Myxococcota bacterium]
GRTSSSDAGAGTEDELPAPPQVAATTPQETDPLPVYTPPRRATPRAMVSGGLRGVQGLPRPLALVPAHVALTSSESPSLFWWVGAVPPEGTSVVLTVVTDDATEPLAEVSLELPRHKGIQRVRLADHGIQLATGVEYEWSISLGTNPASHANDQIASGYVTRVAEPVELTGQRRNVAALAKAGLWYDALSAISDEIEVRPADPRPRQARDALLQQAELTEAID